MASQPVKSTNMGNKLAEDMCQQRIIHAEHVLVVRRNQSLLKERRR